ncbi:MAG: efflux RND transporter periplasmic adaptor subunit [Bacteroidales bacterium]|jgi:multidrug efflux pump subunit AcrA (membrane-fusion protein)|nr:efflux RND transporter periplasmic adaptor subunit [Bacteroidales bacterium]
MRKTIITTGIVAALIIIAMVILSRLGKGKEAAVNYAVATRGPFEISVSNAGELEAERSVDIMGPDIMQASQQGGQRGGRGGMRITSFKIQDIVAEGTEVRKGDYIAQLDRTDYDNTLKTALENMNTLQSNLEMAILDTAVMLTNLRDAIRNQTIAVEEAEINLLQSKYEPPATIRQAEITLNKQIRALEQRIKNYELQKARALTNIRDKKRLRDDGQELVNNLQNFLAQFTITAPSPGMVIYKEEFNGTKRKAGSQVNPFDRVIATLPDLSSMISKTYVSEIEVNKVVPGQKVVITIDAIPGKSWTGSVFNVANIGEQLGNSESKMFEVLIKVDGNNPDLRPAMTTYNKIIIDSFDDVISIPTECVHADADGIPYVYKKNKTKQIVVLGEMNEKHIIIREGLEEGTPIYVITPDEPAKFRLVGHELLARSE